jgi:hypothetical protein
VIVETLAACNLKLQKQQNEKQRYRMNVVPIRCLLSDIRLKKAEESFVVWIMGRISFSKDAE